MPDRHAELRQRLHTLKLPAVARTFSDLALQAAKAHLSHAAYLWELVEAECSERAERRTARFLRASGLPLEKTFRTLQLDRFPPAIRQQVEQLRRCTFVHFAVNLIGVFRPGAGKIDLLAGFVQELILNGKAFLRSSTATLI